MSTAPTPPDSFQRLSKCVSLRQIPGTPTAGPDTPSSHDAPTLILLCTWVEAHPKHIAKYTDRYCQDFPGASLLVVQTSLVDVLFNAGEKDQQKRLKPAIDIINNTNSSSIAVHVFSNGGTVTWSHLLKFITAARRKIIRGIVYDSCPGRATYRRTAHAIIQSLPNKSLRLVLPVVIYPALLLPAMLPAFGIENSVTKARARLNDVELGVTDIRRLYIYSEVDDMVWWRDVRDHAEEARRVGCQEVKEVIFADTAHCAHIKADPDKYWGAVHKMLSS